MLLTMTGNFITSSKNCTYGNILDNAICYSIAMNRSSSQSSIISSLSTNNDKDDKNYVIRTSSASQLSFNSENTEMLEDSNQECSYNIESDCEDATMY